MKTYERNSGEDAEQFPILWTDAGGHTGAIDDGELGEHMVKKQAVRGKGVPGPFKIKGSKAEHEGIVILKGKSDLDVLET